MSSDSFCASVTMRLAVSAASVRRVAGVSLLREFGAAEAVWHFDVEDFRGVVAMDAHGRSLFDDVRSASERRLQGLLEAERSQKANNKRER